jgi:hypothetical protein
VCSFKVIVSNDAAARDAIIRATNNQTSVELASLHATDKVQRDIEDVMFRHGLFYERRKNHYANQGYRLAELVTPQYAAAAFVALALKLPHRAPSLRTRFMRSRDAYECVFSNRTPLQVWPRIVWMLKRVDAELEILRPKGKSTDRFLKGWRYITAFLFAAEAFGRFTFSLDDLAGFDIADIRPRAIESTWRELAGLASSDTRGMEWTSPSRVLDACRHFADARGIKGANTLSLHRDPLAKHTWGAPLPRHLRRGPIEASCACSAA